MVINLWAPWRSNRSTTYYKMNCFSTHFMPCAPTPTESCLSWSCRGSQLRRQCKSIFFPCLLACLILFSSNSEQLKACLPDQARPCRSSYSYNLAFCRSWLLLSTSVLFVYSNVFIWRSTNALGKYWKEMAYSRAHFEVLSGWLSKLHKAL